MVECCKARFKGVLRGFNIGVVLGGVMVGRLKIGGIFKG